MSVNSSCSSNNHSALHYCLSRMNVSIVTAIFISYILLLPLFFLVLYVGYQRWRKQCSVATAAMMKHSDIITFNMVVLELICIFGSSLLCYGTNTNQPIALHMGFYIFCFIFPGQALFLLLTCVECYLAVVHPITYRGLRQAGGVRIRNISIGCVWLLCFGAVSLSKLSIYVNVTYSFLIQVFASAVVTSCSLSVVCVLIRPGPGKVGGNRQRVDQSKKKPFYTIMVVMGALLLRFLSSLVSNVIHVLYRTGICYLGLSAFWFSLPSSLVLPLLFLHRAGKLPGCKHYTA